MADFDLSEGLPVTLDDGGHASAPSPTARRPLTSAAEAVQARGDSSAANTAYQRGLASLGDDDVAPPVSEVAPAISPEDTPDLSALDDSQ